MFLINKKLHQQQYLLLLLFTLLFVSIQLPSYAEDQNTTPENITTTPQNIIDKSLKSIVTVYGRASVGPNGPSKWNGTGFIADIKNGLIVTNAHVVAQGVSEYDVTFSNGQQIQARPLYRDLWLDLAILKIDSNLIPQDAIEIKFNNDLLKLNQDVHIIGNTQGNGFSYHSGTVSDLYAINGFMPQQSYLVNLNIIGGASGSPLLNNKGQACGIIYGGDKTYALALNGKYITNILKQLAEDKEPVRKHMGATIILYSLNDAQRHRNFPSKFAQQYLTKFPDARNRILAIHSTIAGSPAHGKLQMGDIIWKINGKKCGASLYDLDSAMDKAKNNKIELEIYRDGKLQNITLDLYDINQNKITQMLEFAGATFHYTTDWFSAITGVPLNSLIFSYAQDGSAFNLAIHNKNPRVVVQKIGNVETHNLESLIKAIGALNGNRFTTFNFKNYQLYSLTRMDMNYVSAHENMNYEIALSQADFNPKLYTFDKKTLQWHISYPLAEKIGDKGDKVIEKNTQTTAKSN